MTDQSAPWCDACLATSAEAPSLPCRDPENCGSPKPMERERCRGGRGCGQPPSDTHVNPDESGRSGGSDV